MPWHEARVVGNLLGTKIAVNEFVAYVQMMNAVHGGLLGPRSTVIATYALCGFANFGSIGIQIGGIAAIAPERRADVARLGMRAMFAGTLATLMTAAVAGILTPVTPVRLGARPCQARSSPRSRSTCCSRRPPARTGCGAASAR